MGGELTLHNREDGGLEARLSLPRTKRGAQSRNVAQEAEVQWSVPAVKREA